MRGGLPASLVTILVVVLFVAGVVAGAVLTRLVHPAPSTTPQELRSVLPDGVSLRGLVGLVEEVRGLGFLREPRVVMISESELPPMAEPEGDEGLRVWEAVYKLTLLVEPGYDLLESERRFVGSWIAFASGDTVYVVRENVMDMGETALRVLVHELAHVLQSQRFSTPEPTSLDERLSLSALIEGDADVVADIVSERLGVSPVKVSSLPLDDPPLALKYFPYVYGWRFVRYLLAEGGWGLVNEAYGDPPRSTVLVRYPELYLSGYEPGGVRVEPVAGGRVLLNDTLGWFYVYLLVASLTEEDPGALAGAWAGDRALLLAYGDRLVLRWVTSWSTPESARGFARLLALSLGGEERGAGYVVVRDGVTSYLRVNSTYVIIESFSEAPPGF